MSKSDFEVIFLNLKRRSRKNFHYKFRKSFVFLPLSLKDELYVFKVNPQEEFSNSSSCLNELSLRYNENSNDDKAALELSFARSLENLS